MGRPPGHRWILDEGLRGGGPSRSPFWRMPEESCKGLGSVSLKINTQHTQTPHFGLEEYSWNAWASIKALGHHQKALEVFVADGYEHVQVADFKANIGLLQLIRPPNLLQLIQTPKRELLERPQLADSLPSSSSSQDRRQRGRRLPRARPSPPPPAAPPSEPRRCGSAAPSRALSVHLIHCLALNRPVYSYSMTHTHTHTIPGLWRQQD
jgi:hypothetical protein